MSGEPVINKPDLQIKPFDESRYDSIVTSCPEATFYHTRCWARILCRTFPALRDDSKIIAINGQDHAVPLFRWQRLGGLLTTIHSSFPFLYGGPLPCNRTSLSVLLSYLAGQRASLALTDNPFASGYPFTEDSDDLITKNRLTSWGDSTHLLTLPKTSDEFWSGTLTSRKRNDIRRLTRKGVRVELSVAKSDVDLFYSLYLKRMQTWKQPVRLIYPRSLYDNMLELGGDGVKFYVVRFEDALIGGTFVCQFNGISHYQAGYYDHDAGRLRPNVLTQNQIIQDAIDKGGRLYDMLPSAGVESVMKFKESFGGQVIPFRRWDKRGSLHRAQQWLRRRQG